MLAELDLPCDFLAYLQRELGLEQDATVSLLGEWLKSYERPPHTVRIRDGFSPLGPQDDLVGASRHDRPDAPLSIKA